MLRGIFAIVMPQPRLRLLHSLMSKRLPFMTTLLDRRSTMLFLAGSALSACAGTGAQAVRRRPARRFPRGVAGGKAARQRAISNHLVGISQCRAAAGGAERGGDRQRDRWRFRLHLRRWQRREDQGNRGAGDARHGAGGAGAAGFADPFAGRSGGAQGRDATRFNQP